MKTRKIPMRSCVVTKEKYPKQDLVRVVRKPDGQVLVDTTGKLNGRGAYLKKDAVVFASAKKNKILDRILETNIPEEIYNDLEELIK